MDTSSWNDDQFRIFFASLRDHSCDATLDTADRERFVREARARIAPEVQRRLLTDLGATVDPEGVARVAYEILDDEAWGTRRAWLLVTTDPWGVLTELVTRQIRKSYRASMRRRTKGDLDAIARASSRDALPPAGDAPAA